MPNTSFKNLIEENKTGVCIYLLKNETIIRLCKNTQLYRLEIENYREAIDKNNLKLLVFRFYLPKKEKNCIIIFSKEIKEGGFFHFKKRKRKWLYKITTYDETINIYEENNLTSKYCDILDSDENFRDVLIKFFRELGFEKIYKEMISEQKCLKEEVRINA